MIDTHIKNELEAIPETLNPDEPYHPQLWRTNDFVGLSPVPQQPSLPQMKPKRRTADFPTTASRQEKKIMYTQLEQSQQTTSFLTHTVPSQARVSQLEDVTMAEGTAQIGMNGDLQLYATEADVLHGCITGHFQLKTQVLQSPLYILWGAEGQVLTRYGRSTDVVFDLHGAHAGEMRTYLLQVQMTDMKRCIISGLFIQIHVIHDNLL
jgi:hypothetical protein